MAEKELNIKSEVFPTSYQVNHLLSEHADGKVKVFGYLRTAGGVSFAAASPRRTDINLGSDLVSVHLNYDPNNKFFVVALFDQVEIKKSYEICRLRLIADSETDAQNPVYRFEDDQGKIIGQAYGRALNLHLAGLLLDKNLIDSDNYTDNKVIDWIKEKLE